MTPYTLVVEVTNLALEHGMLPWRSPPLLRNERSAGFRDDLGLVFAWENHAVGDWRCTGFLVASIVAPCPLLLPFQIIYPPAVALLPPPGRVTVIAPNTEEGRSFALDRSRRSRARLDHSAAAGRKIAGNPTIQHAPSYLMRNLRLRSCRPHRLIAPYPQCAAAGPSRALQRAQSDRWQKSRRRSYVFPPNSKRWAPCKARK